MTDLEMTKLCAEAMGMSHDDTVIAEIKGGPLTLRAVPEGKRSTIVYDPLHDDAQAMALVKKLDLQITGSAVRRVGQNLWKQPYSMHADLNRAICECVAKMQAAK